MRSLLGVHEVLREVWHPASRLPHPDAIIAEWPMLIPPRYRWLTEGYVRWRGLERIPIATPRSGALIGYGSLGALPAPDEGGWLEGVELDGWQYAKEWHGLSYRLACPTARQRYNAHRRSR